MFIHNSSSPYQTFSSIYYSELTNLFPVCVASGSFCTTGPTSTGVRIILCEHQANPVQALPTVHIIPLKRFTFQKQNTKRLINEVLQTKGSFVFI